MNDFVTIGCKKFKKGYTTGSCAAAAAKAAVWMLVSGMVCENIEINTPAQIKLMLPVSDVLQGEGFAECSVVKDGGDDPDITSGLKIYARAEFNEDKEDKEIYIKAGEGIGMVTLPGLKIEVGEPAINPVPRQMIREAVREVLPAGRGAVITLRIPGGAEAAKKTYNPKLGIVGGISIIGTSGIVEPMSEEAWKDALALELNVLANRGYRSSVFVFGNYGYDFALKDLALSEDRIVKISNFVGYMLDKAAHCGIESILLAGHLGKLVKVAAGIFHTHSRTADARMEILCAYAGLEGASADILNQIYQCRTTGAAADVIRLWGLETVFKRIAENASRRCMDYTYNKIKVGTVLFNEDNTLLYTDDNGRDVIRELMNNE